VPGREALKDIAVFVCPVAYLSAQQARAQQARCLRAIRTLLGSLTDIPPKSGGLSAMVEVAVIFRRSNPIDTTIDDGLAARSPMPINLCGVRQTPLAPRAAPKLVTGRFKGIPPHHSPTPDRAHVLSHCLLEPGRIRAAAVWSDGVGEGERLIGSDVEILIGEER
jgi:hypothetical protein